ncbi:MAG: S8 family serine peptidase, partial [Flavobacteriales bacterium]|nr:S8 family serine peptidase [Flavobacteriales bacterium]
MEEIDEILENNRNRSKAFQTMLDGLTNPKLMGKVNSTQENIDNQKKISLMSKIINRTKKWFLFVGIILFASASFAQSNQGFVPRKIRVKLKSEVQLVVSNTLKANLSSLGDDIVLTGNSQLDLLNKEFVAVKMTRVFPHAGKDEYKHIKHGLNLWYELDIEDNADLKSVANKYLASSSVISAEPIAIKLLGDYKIIDAGVASALEGLPMNDPYLSEQWHYQNDGTLSNSVEGSDINLFPAWEVETGSKDIIVAIVDGGIDVNHEDLAQNIWVNEVEKNGEPGVDDDNNGFIDDINGFDFTNYIGNITGHEHGTHVAGTVGAVNNNGIGVSGVAGGSGNGDGVRLMSCQIFNNDGGSGNYAPAIVYGADNGALISQNSWSYAKDGIFEQSVLDAIDYFTAEAGNYPGSKMKGGVVIFAAGNQGRDSDHYPAYYPGTIAVSSIGPNFIKANYSNFGEWVDVAAPGGNLAIGPQHGVLSTTPNGNYSYMQGTSMACPHVSGIAALIVSHFGSESFTNDELRSRILTGVDDISEYNADYVGKLGSGLINAQKTLEFNSSAVPDAITNLSVIGASQSFVILSWDVPNDDDDVTPISYAVYWSENEITSENVSDANSLVVVNGDKLVGDEFTYEVSSLNSLTQYYFAVIAIDRWGNKSQLSNVVNTQTNEGPEVAADIESLSINIDVNNGFGVSNILNLLNNKSGVLRWEASTREVSNIASPTSVTFPRLQTLKSDNSASVELVKTEEETEFIAAPASTTWSSTNKKYFTTTVPSYVIGETDSTIANSMAIRFYVEEEEGFNLTRVSAKMRLDKVDGPAIIEVYKGNDIAKENLIYSYSSTNTSDGLMSSKEDLTKTYNHNLKEQLLFEKGDTFWIVYHVPPGNLYPLGMYAESSPELSGHCLMSINQGETWRTLESSVEDGGFVWAITASSIIAPLNEYITINPSSGEIAGVGQQELSIDVDASELINGEYISNILINSNDTENPFFRVPLTLNVSGHKPELNSESIVNYGNVFNGLTKTINIEIQNLGYGRFIAESIVSSLPDVFKVNTSYINLAARDEGVIAVEYVPNAAGNDNAVITLTSSNGEVYEFSVFGVGTAPAKIKILPELITFDNIDLNETNELSKSLTISNVGDYPLQFGFTNFADDLSHIEWLGNNNFQRYGYGLGSYPYPEGYVFDDISKTGTDLTHHYKNDGTKQFVEVDLGFDFPYFGEKISKLYVTKRGLITLDDKCKFNATLDFHDKYAPNGYICAYASLLSVETQGSITYTRGVGSFILQYTNVRSVSGPDGQSYTYQIVLYDSGDIKFIYDKIDGIAESSMKNIFMVIENREKTDGLHINGRGRSLADFGPKRIVYIQSPGHDLVKDVVEAKGVILPGKSQEVVLTINREKLVEGTHKELVSILSNDPSNFGKFIEVKIDVVSGGVLDIQIPENLIGLGDLFKNQLVEGNFEIKNNGNKPVTFTSIVSENSSVEYIGKSNVELKPQQTMYVDYTVKTDNLKSIDDNLVIADNEGNTYKVRFIGNVVEAPGIVVSATELTETLEYDEKKIQSLIIENSGVATLEYAISGTSLVYPSDDEGNDILDGQDFTYVYKTTYDEKPATYSWYYVDATNKIPFFTDDFNDFWYKVDLPFTFNFYGIEYSSIWVGMQGAISFDEPTKKQKLIHYPERAGVDDDINNMIAPFYQASMYQDWDDVTKSGVFYNEYDDKLIIEWREFFNATGGAAFDRQLILYKDG